jgi:hypothetical protein
MNGTDMNHLTMVLQSMDAKKNSDHVVFLDTPNASAAMVRGFNKYEQYAKKLTPHQLSILTTLCEWNEDEGVWIMKLNATLPTSLKKWKF